MKEDADNKLWLKLGLVLLALLVLAALTGCAASYTPPGGATFSLGFTPTGEQIDSLRGFQK